MRRFEQFTRISTAQRYTRTPQVSFLKSTFPILILSFLILTFICGCEKSTGLKRDTTPPAAITDLRIVTDKTPITLTWTAPGDDGNEGTAAWYSIRYSADSAVITQWYPAFQFKNEPAPEPSGAKQEFIVKGLAPDSNYYFAIRAQDEAGNWSPPSNIASGFPVAAGGIAFVSDRDGNYEVYVISSSGSHLKNITRNDADDWDPGWSRDRRIAFVSNREGVWKQSDIYVADSEGTNVRRLTFGKESETLIISYYWPVFSPDGFMIAFQYDSSGGWGPPAVALSDINIMNSNGTNPKNVTEDSGPRDFEPAWSPDGRNMAFVSTRDGSYQIYIMDSDGSNQRRLTNNNTWDFSPLWSPDGKRILFLCMSTARGPSDLCVINVDGTDQRKLTSDGSSFHAAWSPDGLQIAYESDRDICVMNARGSNKKQLTTHPGYDGQPAWSPDGTRIAFVSDRDGNDEIYVMNGDGTHQQNVSNHRGTDFSPAWSGRPALRLADWSGFPKTFPVSDNRPTGGISAHLARR